MIIKAGAPGRGMDAARKGGVDVARKGGVDVIEITRRGAEIPKTPDTLRLARKELVVAPIDLQNVPKTFRVFVETPTKLIVPVHWAVSTLRSPHIRDLREPPSKTRLEFQGALRPDLHQLEAVSAVRASWQACGGAMLSLATGLGKTTCAIHLAVELGLKTLVVVHKDFLARQWEDRIRAHVPGATVTMVRGATCDTSGDFVIAMLQTLVSRRHPPSTFAACGLVVVDEAHHISAPGFSQAMWGLCAQYTLALTATPERRDGLGRLVNWFMGPIAMRVGRTNTLSTTIKTVRYACPRYDQPPPLNRRGDVCYASIMTALVEDAERTRLVAGLAADLARAGRHVLVLSHRRSHCAEVCSLLTGMGIETATYMGGDKDVPDTRVIVATYALTSEGFDCPRLTALVLGTPASNVVQSCGRVMRGTTASDAIIVDVVDAWGVCYAQHAKRRAFYRKSGFRIECGAEPSAHADPLPAYAFTTDT